MAHLVTQPHQNYNQITDHHSEPSGTELNGSPTTTELKKSHPSRLVEGQSFYSRVVDKNSGGIISGVRVPAPYPGFQCQEVKPP